MFNKFVTKFSKPNHFVADLHAPTPRLVGAGKSSRLDKHDAVSAECRSDYSAHGDGKTEEALVALPIKTDCGIESDEVACILELGDVVKIECCSVDIGTVTFAVKTIALHNGWCKDAPIAQKPGRNQGALKNIFARTEFRAGRGIQY